MRLLNKLYIKKKSFREDSFSFIPFTKSFEIFNKSLYKRKLKVFSKKGL